jgi:dual specificity protein kinase YAK1
MVTANTNPPPNSYYPSSRNRANTINQMDAIPPALARLTHFSMPDPSGQRNLTPVLNRGDDPYREWELRQAGGHSKKSSLHNASYPQLEYLQEQAELQAMGNQWMIPGHAGHYSGGHSRTNSQHYQPQPPIADGRTDYRARPSISTMPEGNYLPAFPPPAAQFDGFDRDQNLGVMYTPLQPNFTNQPYAPGHQARASYSGQGYNNPFANQPNSPRYNRRSQGYQ